MKFLNSLVCVTLKFVPIDQKISPISTPSGRKTSTGAGPCAGTVFTIKSFIVKYGIFYKWPVPWKLLPVG